MSNLYNILNGQHVHAQLAITALNTPSANFGRFRDAWFERDEKGVARIAIYTRCGGGNRDDYDWVFEEAKAHENYLFDRDEDFDRTYATIYFSIPEEFRERIEEWMPKDTAPVDTSDRWQAIDNIGKKGD